MTAKTMAEVLNEHIQSVRNRRCSCGWRGDVSKSIIDPENIHWQHRQHVAEALSAAGFGLVAEARAQALEDAADAVAAQRDATNPDATHEEAWSVIDHRAGRFLGKTVAARLLRARAAAERGEE